MIEVIQQCDGMTEGFFDSRESLFKYLDEKKIKYKRDMSYEQYEAYELIGEDENEWYGDILIKDIEINTMKTVLWIEERESEK